MEQLPFALPDEPSKRCPSCGQRKGVDDFPRNRSTRDGRAAHVDHDHLTGAARSLLCFTCSSGLGHFRDEPELLRLAAEYLDRHEAAAVKARAASLRPI